MIIAEHRRTVFSDPAQSDIRTFEPGATLAAIVAAFDKPAEFEEYGAVYIEFAMVPRELWHVVRPKDGRAIFLSCVPQDSGGNQFFAIVAAVALVALTAFVGAGGLALMAPALAGAFGAGTIGASIAAATIGIAGQTALSLLTQPAAGAAATSGAKQTLAQAGVSPNALGAYVQIPAVVGTMVTSPPHLVRPYTTITSTAETVHGVVGLCGPLKIEDIRINDIALADLPDVEVETREGWDDDADLTLVDRCAYEENVNQQLSSHLLDDDGQTLLAPATDGYPTPMQFKTAGYADRFRLLLQFPSGFYNQDTDNKIINVFFRLRVRRRDGVGTWINLPELNFKAQELNPLLQEIVLAFAPASGAGAALDSGKIASGSSHWPRAFYANQEWQADAYFFSSGASWPSVNVSVSNVVTDSDRVLLYLDPATFPKIKEGYDVEITKSACVLRNDVSDTVYPAGVFTYQSFSSPQYKLTRNQQELVQTIVVQNYTTFRAAYPILERGLALIAFSAKNLQVQSISATFTSYVPTWGGSAWGDALPTSNCAALLRSVLVGALNARPVPLAIMETLGDFYDHCEAIGLQCNALIAQGTVEDVASLVAQCGDAVLRRSDKWGVVIDRDRSAESVQGMFGPHNMTTALTMTKSFITGSQGVVPSFYDAANNYAVTERSSAIYMEGIQSSETTPVESASYDGYTDLDLVERRVRLDLRRTQQRAIRYNWGVHQEHLNNRKGDLVAVAHDILIDHYANGRVKSFTSSGGHLETVTLNTDIADAPITGFDDLFEVDSVMRLADLFALTGSKMGLQLRLSDGSVIVVAVSAVDGGMLTVEGTVAMPSALRSGDLGAVGPRGRETRRLIINTITPADELMASIEAFDEAPGIFEGL